MKRRLSWAVGPSIALVVAAAICAAIISIPRGEAAFSATTANTGNSFAAAASFGVTLYLHDSPSPPVADTASLETLPLDAAAPTATILRNYDTNRDAFAGIVIAKGVGLGETDPFSYQNWRHTPSGALALAGDAELVIWTAMKDFQSGKNGAAIAGLHDCNSSGGSCSLIQSATRTDNPWPSGWQAMTFDFGVINHTIASGRSLRIKLAPMGASSDDLWFAYDTTAYPARLDIS